MKCNSGSSPGNTGRTCVEHAAAAVPRRFRAFAEAWSHRVPLRRRTQACWGILRTRASPPLFERPPESREVCSSRSFPAPGSEAGSDPELATDVVRAKRERFRAWSRRSARCGPKLVPGKDPGCGAARGVSIRYSLLAVAPSTGLLTHSIPPC
jgi:hypothetical protein